MARPQPIRRYGKIEYALMCFKYHAHRITLFPFKAALLTLRVVAGLCAVLLLGGVLDVAIDCAIYRDITILLFYIAAVILCPSLWLMAHRAIVYVEEAVPEGHLLKPRPPKENTILSPHETLVRSAAGGEAPGSDELLRVPQSRTESAPEELLRASGS